MSKVKQYLISSPTIRESRWLFRYSIRKLDEEGLIECGDFQKCKFVLRDGTSYRFAADSEHDVFLDFHGMILSPIDFIKLIRRKYKCVLEL